MPIEPVCQVDRAQKKVFVLGVYASAVHARWVSDKGKTLISALAVASEPEIFWRGENAAEIVSRISVPTGAGRLVAANNKLNGPSGVALYKMFLTPLGIDRNQAWLCDLLPESRCNPKQAAALHREYLPAMERLGLPRYNFPPVPSVLVSDERVLEIEKELLVAAPQVFITLGDQPLKWFMKPYGSKSRLASYGETKAEYGRLHNIEVAGRKLKLLPLAHPRQAGKLGSHSSKWNELHTYWVENIAPGLLGALKA